ncbi:hypothetical protein AKO1_011905 [Acrasis kona]|uniref:Uncharacterized protein n=1 Tax=Acrasis kona TaxID=1008807 RepID=A0AAW2ZA10_9EUKA
MGLLSNILDKNKTFRPKKKFSPDTRRYSLHKHCSTSLGTGQDNLSGACKCPEDSHLNDWLAVNVIDFYNKINLLYGSIRDDCNELINPNDKRMGAGPHFEYLWMDKKKYKVATTVSAPMYASLTMDWIEEIINDENIFPIDEEKPFPKSFKKNYVKPVWKKLFRIMAHIMIEHF